MKALLFGNALYSIDKIAGAQLEPFFRNRSGLRKRLDLTFEHVQVKTLPEIEQVCNASTNADVLIIRIDWREKADQVVQMFQSIRQANPTQKIFFIDPWDQVSSRFFGVLPYVDRLLKYQRLKDVQMYQQPLAGGTVITNYLAQQGYDLNGWHIGSEVPHGYEHRIVTGWNIVTDKQFEATLFQFPLWKLKNRRWRTKPKDIDIFCHLSYDSIHSTDSWYTRYRQSAVAAVQQLAPTYTLAVSGEYPEARRVSSRQYHDDIQRSRIVFSPFGWGETTWRDYEAICNNCLLLKPDIGHIDTAPNIYHADQTYVPLKWDFSDLEEKCHYYLQNPDKAAQIRRNARQVLERYFTQAEFVDTIGRLLNDVGLTVPANAMVTSTGLSSIN